MNAQDIDTRMDSVTVIAAAAQMISFLILSMLRPLSSKVL